MRMKKFLTCLLTIAMVVSLLPATAFAANNTATTMRLAKTQGTVAVTNATGKKVKQTSNMKLYNGYKLKTGAKSYAWISLDDTKVAKLDANSVVSVQKTGQKLTLYLSSGNLFFNVKETLKSGESFHIKTSTMTTGIRGTSGCVRVINPRVSEIHLLTGRIEVHAEHPELHLTKSEVLTAGNMATSLIDQEAMELTGEQVEIIVEELQEHNVCGNCATEVAADPALQERIEEETDLDVEEIVNDAEEKLEEDELAAEEEQAAIEEAEAEQELPEDVDPYFQEETASGGGGGGGSSATVPSNIITVTNWQEFVAALTEFNDGTEDTEIRLAADIEPDAGVTMMPEVEDNGASLTLNLQEYGLSIPQPLVNNGDLTITNVDGYITAYDFENWTTPRDIVQNYGTLIHLAGQIQMPGGYNGVYNQGNYTLNGGTFDRFAESDGDPTGAVENSGTFQMQDGAVTWPVTNDGTATISGGTVSHVIVNNDTMTISGGAMTDNEVFNGNWIQNNGEMDITGGTFTYHGKTDLMEGSISIASGAELNITGGTFTDEGVLIGNKGGTFSMTGGQMTVSSESAERDIEAYYDAAGGTATIGGSAKISIDVSGIGNYIVAEQLNAIQLASAGAELTLTGGTIEVNGLENENTVCGVRVTNGTFHMTGGNIEVNDSGTGVFGGGEIELAGGRIYAYDDSVAVDLTYGGDMVRPIAANVTWVYQDDPNVGDRDDEANSHLLTPESLWDDMITKTVATTPDGLTFVSMVDGYGKVPLNVTVTTTDQFIAALAQYSAGAGDTSITLGADIAVTTNDPVPLLQNTASVLTIDLNDKTLTLDQLLGIDEGTNVKIIDNGTNGTGIVAGTADPLISNAGTFELAGGTMNPIGKAVVNTGDVVMSGGVINVAADNTYGIHNNGGTLTISDGDIYVTAEESYGVYGENDEQTKVTGGSISVSVAGTNGYGIYTTGSVIDLNGGTFTVSNSGNSAYAYGVYGETGSTITLNDPTVINVETDQAIGINSRMAYSTVVMNGGTINIKDCIGILAAGQKMTMTGGTINMSGSADYGVRANCNNVVMTGGTINVGADTENAIGMSGFNDSTAFTMNGTDDPVINVYSDTGKGIHMYKGYDGTVFNGGTVHAYSGVAIQVSNGLLMTGGTYIAEPGATVIRSISGGTLNIEDCDIQVKGSSNSNSYGINIDEDEFTTTVNFKGGKITVTAENETSSYPASGIRNTSLATTNITDGKIIAQNGATEGILNLGMLNIAGGTISTQAENAEGIDNTGEMVMTDGTIEVTQGIGIVNGAFSTVTVSGGIIDVDVNGVGITNNVNNASADNVQVTEGVFDGDGLSAEEGSITIVPVVEATMLSLVEFSEEEDVIVDVSAEEEPAQEISDETGEKETTEPTE